MSLSNTQIVPIGSDARCVAFFLYRCFSGSLHRWDSFDRCDMSSAKFLKTDSFGAKESKALLNISKQS